MFPKWHVSFCLTGKVKQKEQKKNGLKQKEETVIPAKAQQVGKLYDLIFKFYTDSEPAGIHMHVIPPCLLRETIIMPTC